MNIREAMMDSAGQKVDLQEIGTRFDHYMELKETFMLGIEVINGMRPEYIGPGDRALKAKLTNAVEVIDRRLLYLSEYDIKSIAMGREIRAAGIHRMPRLTEGSDAKPEDQKKDISKLDSGKIEGSTSSESECA